VCRKCIRSVERQAAATKQGAEKLSSADKEARLDALKAYMKACTKAKLWNPKHLNIQSEAEALLSHVAPEQAALEADVRMHLPTVDANCGSPESNTECALDYTMASVNESVTQSLVSREAHVKDLQTLHDKARQACMASADKGAKILEDGGWCYDKNQSDLVNKSQTSDIDYLLPLHHVVADDVLVSVLAEKVLLREDGSCCHSITDLGAGVGQIGHALRARLPQLEYHGYDGAGNVEEFTKNYVNFTDLTIPLILKPTDWVISSEVGEHIPHMKEAQVIANLHAHNCKGVILTWAVVGQGGNGHVNCHSSTYLTKIFEDLGYKKNDGLTAALRAHRSDHQWLMKSSMAFERITKPSTC